MAKGLGKGLSALFGDNSIDIEEKIVEIPAKEAVVEIERSLIYPNPDQPRKFFDEDALEELADSIKLHGIIQPIVVVKKDDKYMIIAGERRWRAAGIAGLVKVPVVVNPADTDQKIKELSLIENLQREDLNPVEAANAIKQLMEVCDYTQEQVADRLGKNRSTIANTLRLLNLYPQVLALVSAGRLSAGHARTLVVVAEEEIQLKMAKAAMDNKISVRDLEKMVREYLNPKPPKPKAQVSLELKEMVNDMQRVFGTKVSVLGNDHKGRIYIDYYTRDDLDRINDLIQKNKPE